MARHQTSAVRCAYYKPVTVGDEHDIWVRYGPDFGKAIGDARHTHGHRTEAAKTVRKPHSTPTM